MTQQDPRSARDPHPQRPARARTVDGLCPHCAHVRRVESAKGSVFLLCELSRTDLRFTRYPPQPRMECAGFES